MAQASFSMLKPLIVGPGNAAHVVVTEEVMGVKYPAEGRTHSTKSMRAGTYCPFQFCAVIYSSLASPF